MDRIILASALIMSAALTPLHAGSQVLSLGGGTARAGSSEHEGSRQGRLVGARLTLPLSGAFGLDTGLGYVERNLPPKYAVSSVAGQFQSLAYENAYVEVPVYLKASLFSSAAVSPFALVGSTIGFHVRCRLVTALFSAGPFGQTQSLGQREMPCDDDVIGRSVNRFQVDVAAGMGLDIRMPAGLVGTVEFVYGHGLLKIFDLFAAMPRGSIIWVGIGLPIG